MRFGLRWKILILATSTPIVLAQAVLLFVDHRLKEYIRSTTEADLRRSALVCENDFGGRSRTLQATAQAIARDPRFHSALTLPVSPNDPQYQAIVRGVARELNKIAEADLFEVLDGKGRVITSAGTVASNPRSRLLLIEQLKGRQSVSGILKTVKENDSRILQATAHTVLADGRTVGMLLLGESIDDDLGKELKALTSCEITFYDGGRILATTLPAGAKDQVWVKMIEMPASPAEASEDAISVIKITAETYLTLARTIPGAGAATSTGFLVQRSLEGEKAFMFGIHAGLNKLGILIVLMALILAHLVSHKITAPLQQLVRGAEEMEKGNYEHPIDVRTNDEIGYLADRFLEIREHEQAYVSSLEEAARLKSEFLSIASHELRTPVSIIKAYGELLFSERLGTMNIDQKNALEVIDQQLEGIEQIVDDAAWLSKVQGARPTLELADHIVRDLIKGAMESATNDAPGRKVRFVTEIDQEPGQVRVDGKRLIHAVANLVRNAIRFTPDSGLVYVRARKDGENLLIEVQDTGIGIAEDKKQHLFDRSFMFRDSLQHHSSRTLEFNSAGLGLGLPMARGIVEAHGGSLQVASEKGRGSTFTIHIPINPPAEGQAAAA